jgi:hypothetical protein
MGLMLTLSIYVTLGCIFRGILLDMFLLFFLVEAGAAPLGSEGET